MLILNGSILYRQSVSHSATYRTSSLIGFFVQPSATVICFARIFRTTKWYCMVFQGSSGQSSTICLWVFQGSSGQPSYLSMHGHFKDPPDSQATCLWAFQGSSGQPSYLSMGISRILLTAKLLVYAMGTSRILRTAKLLAYGHFKDPPDSQATCLWALQGSSGQPSACYLLMGVAFKGSSG